MDKRIKRGSTSRNIPLPFIGIMAAAALLLVAGIALLVMGSPGEGSKTGPRLSVNQDRIDFGRVPLDKTVRAEFQLTNTGDAVLTLDTSTPVQVLEGC